MIKTKDKERVGSQVSQTEWAKAKSRKTKVAPEVEAAVSAFQAQPQDIVIIGPPGVGKSLSAMWLLAHINRAMPERHEAKQWERWYEERDFITDLKHFERLKDLTVRLPNDDGLWADYTAWDSGLLEHRTVNLLAMDDIGHGYTPYHAYEVEGLYRSREVLGLPTITTVQLEPFEIMTTSMKSVLTRNAIVVPLKERFDAGR